MRAPFAERDGGRSGHARNYETYREDPPAVSAPIVSDCTIVGQYHDKPYCFGNSYQGYATARANLGGRGAY